MKKSKYLSEENRLADVIAAIQAMGTYKYYKLDFKGWSKRISGTENNSKYWENVIIEHSEFFRLNSDEDKASLVWRRNYQRTYHIDLNKALTREECNSLPEKERQEKISRQPLSSENISVLVNTAINLHNRALEKEKESRWWVLPLTGISGIIIGTLLKAYL